MRGGIVDRRLWIVAVFLFACEACVQDPPWREPFGYDRAHLHALEIRDFGYPWVPVGFGADTVWLPFDTGDMVGLTVDSAIFDRLGLPCTERWNRMDSGGRLISTGCTAHGVGVEVFGAHHDSLSVFEFSDPSLPGLVGPAQLPGTRFTIDYGRRLLATDSNTVSDVGPPFETFPLVRSPRDPLLILTYAQVQGTDVLVEIDTGKSRTTIDRSLVEALGLPVTDQGAEVGEVRLGSWSWTVGSAHVVDTSGISEDLPARIALGIGSDVLRDFVLSVDYRSGHLWLAPRS
jgi:hypothetical protein